MLVVSSFYNKKKLYITSLHNTILQHCGQIIDKLTLRITGEKIAVNYVLRYVAFHYCFFSNIQKNNCPVYYLFHKQCKEQCHLRSNNNLEAN